MPVAPVDQFIAAIVQQETGGEPDPYKSRWGKYAMNPAYINSYALKYLGRPMSAQQYLSSPANQDLLGRAALTALYNQYGAQGAASSWYSGNPTLYNSTRSQPGGPSIKGYVDSVMRRMGTFTENIDLSKQPPDSPISPWQTQMPPVQSTPNPVSAATGMGLDAVTDPLGASTGGLGLGAADGTDPTPGMDAPVPAPQIPTAGAGTGTSGGAVYDPSSGPIKVPAIGLRASAIEMAMKAYGKPYVWGGNSLQYGVDCSGLVQQALKSIGINVPRVSYAQLKLGPRVGLAQAQPGDLIGWGDGHHVALYLGNNQILEAPRTGLNVRVRTLGDSWDKSQGYYAVSLANYYR